MDTAVYIGLIATFCIYFPTIPLSIYYVTPLSGKSWEELITTQVDVIIYWTVVQGALSIALDIYIFVLPLPTLAQLQMSPKTRRQLIGVFATALM